MPQFQSASQGPPASVDITAPDEAVQVEYDKARGVLYVHVDGATALRICRIRPEQYTYEMLPAIGEPPYDQKWGRAQVWIKDGGGGWHHSAVCPDMEVALAVYDPFLNDGPYDARHEAASLIFRVPRERVTLAMRDEVKNFEYHRLYGGSRPGPMSDPIV